ncbi:MAG: N-acetylmuramoyl-L-alanine amidase [Oscillatoriales cyanobacterium SM2_2_1]|nr:N-acetylmuramoyl-L-alanine amidase [Oscillatoriales cyanobacterium SM2_2_1]
MGTRWLWVLAVILGLGSLLGGSSWLFSQELSPIAADRVSALHLTYPPPNHRTTADRLFLIGSAPPEGVVRVNGRVIPRSRAGHFAPTVPLVLGLNNLVLHHDRPSREIRVQVLREPITPVPPTDLDVLRQGFEPQVPVMIPVGDVLCFRAIATPAAEVSLQVGENRISLMPTPVLLPGNGAALTGRNQPIPATGHYAGCNRFEHPDTFTKAIIRLRRGGQELSRELPVAIAITAASPQAIATVRVPQGVARSGPGTDFSRLTPLPRGTVAHVIARHGDWLRLALGDYTAWIRQQEVEQRPVALLPPVTLRSISARDRGAWTEIHIPLDRPVPLAIGQRPHSLSLSLFGVTPQTDTIAVPNLYWQQESGDRLTLTLERPQWGYRVRYDGTTLVLSLRQPPRSPQLRGQTILLDPGHGGPEDLGARGSTGYPEKAVTLRVARLLQRELERRGATVILTRTEDRDLGLQERVAQIEQAAPAIALSLHYNALPDDGDAAHTAGIGTFWFQPQSQPLAQFLHDDLIRQLQRPSYGVFWNNLALTRPTDAPAVLLELGFMIHPEEFSWIVDPLQQQKLAIALAQSIERYFILQGSS